MARDVIVTAKKIKKREEAYVNTKIALGILLLLLFIIFIILNFIYNTNCFTITLDRDLEKNKGIVIYEDIEGQNPQRKLFATSKDNMSDMSILWLPNDIHTSSNGGSHNGDNYIAYTFYIDNQGIDTIDYWYQIIIDDVIKGVDEAVRVVIYHNDEERLVYAKLNEETKLPEKDTIPFFDEKEGIVALNERKGFKVNEKDKYTIVIFLEGDDPDCLNDKIGGELKMHMEITEEIKKEVKDE